MQLRLTDSSFQPNRKIIAGTALALILGNAGCTLSESEMEENATDDELGTQEQEIASDLDALFTLDVTPPSATVRQDFSAFFSIGVDPLDGFSGNVDLSVRFEPEFIGQVSLFPRLVTPPDSADLVLFTRCDTVPGTYDVHVTGRGDDDSTESESVVLTVEPNVAPPSAFISFSRQDLRFQFSPSDFPGGCAEIVSWQWDFGDGTGSSERSPAHTYAQRGDYTVTLTVVQSDGLSDTDTRTVTALPPPPVLEIEAIRRLRETFEFRVDLVWSGAEGEFVELYRNSSLVDLPDNTGEHRDRFRSPQTQFSWRVCELGIAHCSNTVSVDFGPNLTASQATVTTEIEGRKIVHKVPIKDGD